MKREREKERKREREKERKREKKENEVEQSIGAGDGYVYPVMVTRWQHQVAGVTGRRARLPPRQTAAAGGHLSPNRDKYDHPLLT